MCPARPARLGRLRPALIRIRLLGLGLGLGLVLGRRRGTAGRRGGNSPWRCLRYPSMRWWSAANLVSNAGTWMQLTVQNLLVLQITHSPAAAGLSIAVQAAPGLLLGLAGGAAVDAWPRKRVAAASQAALALVAFTTAALVAADLLSVGTLLALAAVTGLIATVDGPACALLGNDLVEEEDVPSSIALGSVVHSVGRLVGAALAGVAVSLLGPAAAYAGNGLSFVCVAAVVPFLRLLREDGAAPESKARVPAPRDAGRALAPRDAAPRPPGAAPGTAPGAPATASGTASGTAPARSGGGSREGLRYFLRSPRLLGLAWITALSSVFGRNYTLTLAVLVTGPLHQGAGAFGTVSTVLALGGIAGAVIAGRLRRPSVRLVGTLAAAGALLQVGAGLAPSLLVVLLLVVPMAVVESISDTAGASVLQTHPPAHLRGRVLGVWRSASTGWTLVGPPLLGLLLQVGGARGALVCGGLLIAGGIAAAAFRHDREAAARHVRRTVSLGVSLGGLRVRAGAAARPDLSTAA